MINRTAINTFLTITLSLACTLAYASGLTDRQITRYLAAMEELDATDHAFDEHDKAWDQHVDEYGLKFETMVSDSLTFMKERDPESYRLVERISRNNGFSSVYELAGVGDRIMLAYMNIESAEYAPMMEETMRETLAEIEANTFLSEEQKENMRHMMQQSRAQMSAALDAPKADVEAVRPHLSAIREFVGSYDDEDGWDDESDW